MRSIFCCSVQQLIIRSNESHHEIASLNTKGINITSLLPRKICLLSGMRVDFLALFDYGD